MSNKKKFIDPDEIPPQTDEQLKLFLAGVPEDVEAARKALEKKYGIKIAPRVGRAALLEGQSRKYKHVNMRIAPDVLTRVRAAACAVSDYQTLINKILRRAA